MFSTYQYNSGVSQTIRDYFSWLADEVIALAPPGASTVLELACNDGSQLDEFARRGWKTYGVDPAHNIVQTALAKGHSVSIAFWGVKDAVDPTMPMPDVIIAQNVLAHVPDPVSFLKSCQSVMGAASRLYIQTSQCNMYENGEFDTIYHEHLSYFTAASMARAAMEAGLRIVNARKTPIHGTSFLFTMMRNDDPTIYDPDPSLTAILDHERSLGIYNKACFTRFNRRAHDIRDWINIAVADYKRQGYSIAAFGAAAKGMTALSFFGLHEQIDYIVDDAKMKQGRYTPATNIIIKPPGVLREDTRNLAIIILAWNFATEISQKIRQHRSSLPVRTAIICCFPNQTIETLLSAD
jgi:SAM-dependent methyltransferase